MRGPLAINPSKGPWVFNRRGRAAGASRADVPPAEANNRGHHRPQIIGWQFGSLRPIRAALLAKHGAALSVVLLANPAPSNSDLGLGTSRVLGRSPFIHHCHALPTTSRYTRRISHLSCCTFARCECLHGYGCVPRRGTRPPVSLRLRGLNPPSPAVNVTAAGAAEVASSRGNSTPFICPTSVAAGTGALASPGSAHPYSSCPKLRPHGVGLRCRASWPLPSLQSLPDHCSPGLCGRVLWRGWRLRSFAAECHGLIFNTTSTAEMKLRNNNGTEGCCQPTCKGGSAIHEIGGDIGGGGQGAAGGSGQGKEGSGDSGGGLVETGKGGGVADVVGVGGHTCTSATWPPEDERLAAVVQRLRALPQELYPPVSPRAAAVLVGLFEDRSGAVRVLLTQRSAQLKSHRGEVCLPGAWLGPSLCHRARLSTPRALQAPPKRYPSDSARTSRLRAPAESSRSCSSLHSATGSFLGSVH
ncbi:hypothetical protein Vafri_8873 [Volvox africanus]|uniref:Nudix hydrolase domain-containing protein n=1 Tax=Volvox africanus TaxID=51714 RepID=A0A8J4B379_9CHLO|nr:hypothetical protein Vafri_8873 [Volvox africanus]